MKNSIDELLKQAKSIAESSASSERHSKAAVKIGVPIIAILGAVGLVSIVMETRDVDKAVQRPLGWSDIESDAHNGELSKALSEADGKLAKVPRDFSGHYMRGQIRLMNGDRAGAVADFQAAYDIFPIYTYKAALDAVKK